MNLFKFLHHPSGKTSTHEDADWLSLGIDSAQCFVDIIRKAGKPCVLDLGYTSSQNIEFFTKLGCKIYASGLIKIMIDDLKERAEAFKRKGERSRTKTEKGPKEEKEPPSVFSILVKSLDYPTQKFDGILCWDVFDFCDSSTAADLIAELKKLLKQGGAVLSIFHGTIKPGRRWTGSHCFSVDGRLKYKVFSLDEDIHTRFYENRMIQDLFSDFSIERFVHLRDTSRIVLVRMKPHSQDVPVKRSMEEEFVRQK